MKFALGFLGPLYEKEATEEANEKEVTKEATKFAFVNERGVKLFTSEYGTCEEWNATDSQHEEFRDARKEARSVIKDDNVFKCLLPFEV